MNEEELEEKALTMPNPISQRTNNPIPTLLNRDSWEDYSDYEGSWFGNSPFYVRGLMS